MRYGTSGEYIGTAAEKNSNGGLVGVKDGGEEGGGGGQGEGVGGTERGRKAAYRKSFPSWSPSWVPILFLPKSFQGNGEPNGPIGGQIAPALDYMWSNNGPGPRALALTLILPPESSKCIGGVSEGQNGPGSRALAPSLSLLTESLACKGDISEVINSEITTEELLIREEKRRKEKESKVEKENMWKPEPLFKTEGKKEVQGMGGRGKGKKMRARGAVEGGGREKEGKAGGNRDSKEWKYYEIRQEKRRIEKESKALKEKRWKPEPLSKPQP
jgi:hypothetical protein